MASLKELIVKIGADTKGLDDGIGKATTGLSAFGVTAGAVAAAAAAAIAAVGAAALKVGMDWESATATIRTGTGATGQALDDLRASAQNIFTDLPVSAGLAAQAIADLNTRTGLAGPALETLATQTLNLARITGEDLGGTIAATTRVFGDWSIATENQAAANDYLFKTSQATGIGLTTLANTVVQFGAPMRQLGFSFEETAALMGKFEQEGVNLETVMSGLRIGLSNLGRAGLEPAEGFRQAAEAIKSAGDTAAANTIAMEVFGQRAGADMAAAIREGRFEIDELVSTLTASSETINQAAEDTLTLGDKFSILTNNISLLLEPLGSFLVDSLNAAVTWILQLGSEIGTVVDGFVIWIGELRAANEGFDGFVTGLSAAVNLIAGSVIAGFTALGTVLGWVGDKIAEVWNFFKEKGTPATKEFGEAAKAAKPDTESLTKALDGLKTKAGDAEKPTKAVGFNLKEMGKAAKDAKLEVFNLEKAISAAEKVAKDLERTAKDAARALATDMANAAQAVKVDIDAVAAASGDAMAKIQTFTGTAADSWNAMAAQSAVKAAEVDAAFKALGLNTVTELNTMATEAQARFETIKNSGQATPQAINVAWIAALEARKAAMEANGQALTKADADLLAQLLKQQEGYKTQSTGVFTEWANGVTSVVHSLNADLVKGLFSGDFSSEGIKNKLSSIADSFKDVFVTKALDHINQFVDKGIKFLMAQLDNVIAKLTGSNGVSSAMNVAFGGASSAGGAATGGATSIPGAGGIPSGGGGGGGGAAGSAGGAMGAVNMITGIATAISSIFGNFQMAAMNATLDLIEEQVRRTAQYLGDRGDGGLIAVAFKTNELLGWGPIVKAVEQSRDYLATHLGPIEWSNRAIEEKTGLLAESNQEIAQANMSMAIEISSLRSELVALLMDVINRPVVLEVDGQELARVVGANQEALRATA